MRRIALTFAIVAGALLAVLAHPGGAYAQATRTWVSGVGDDANPCSRTAPCKTFAGAISKTATFGEIDCLDPGGFGAITITKSITLDCTGTFGSVLVSGTNGIVVSLANATDVVTIRGLSINGLTTGLSGIRFIGNGTLNVDHVDIFAFTQAGVDFEPTANAELYVSDTFIHDNITSASTPTAVLVKATAGTVSKATLIRVNAQNNFFGLKADGSGASGGVINMTITDSKSTENASNGIVGTTPAGGAAIVMLCDHDTPSHNLGFGVIADGPLTTIRIGNMTIGGNATGVGTSNGGTLQSYKTNEINGNSNDGTAGGLPAVQLN
ncbi:MAG: right-handed parallel beta-helix repeat-containing protein [Methylobacteriaceae bacterium]|nr:right-handed parallel beta-helix repeat-containing protein [Methylobacteriaceae bacterium]MBV9244949.1 right-handed parallel beta-helix repeat-containing protein [Methylobacteriaceae bacterium]MBV9634700.1 right-handed parallel beta-helix repeat-containing protein [Methylobacteriaceae bacterium]